jgi:hypothetical protein
MQPEQIKEFLSKYEAGTHSEAEHQAFTEWLKTASIEQLEEIAEAYKITVVSKETSHKVNSKLVSKMEAALDQYDLGRQQTKPIPGRVVFMNQFKRIAAAVIIITIGTGVYFTFFNKPSRQVPVGNELAETKDVPPPNTMKAFITLSDGRKVYIDSAANGTIATDGNVKVSKLSDGQIAYNSTNEAKVMINTLTVPKGSKPMKLLLADGTEMWLDAATTVSYPNIFIGKERKVELITGQVYFEVAHNAAMPFKVKKGDSEVEVLGTHFNMNAFDDEAAMKVTLLEGSVAISEESGVGSRERTVIKPGEQAQVANNIKVIKAVDVDAVMAWKNGLFNFNNSDLEMVMRQLARWYDVEVMYQGSIPKRSFGGEMQRDLNLSDVLKILEKNNVRFKIEGKRLIVLP